MALYNSGMVQGTPSVADVFKFETDTSYTRELKTFGSGTAGSYEFGLTDARFLITANESGTDGGGNLVGSDTHLIQLDNTGPDASIEIITGLGNCGKFVIGTVLSGNFVARDDYLGSYSLGVEPAVNPLGVGVPVPSSGLANTAPAPGDAWTLDTAGMRPCGYVIRVVVSDLAIVNSQSVGLHLQIAPAFALRNR